MGPFGIYDPIKYGYQGLCGYYGYNYGIPDSVSWANLYKDVEDLVDCTGVFGNFYGFGP